MTNPIIGIPTSRITQIFVRDQTLRQTQASQLALAKLQAQMASGYRYQIPSEDPIASMQVQSLQRLLEQKNQVKSNIQTTQSTLDATDSSLESVFNLMVNARSLAVGAVGTTINEIQRLAAAQQIDETITQLINMGNQQFRGQYLFSGSESINAPFQETALGMVEYLGNTQNLVTYSDLNLLTTSNVTGQEAFGVISSEVKGTPPVIPSPNNFTRVADLTYNTRLTDLRQGQGISKGSIIISDGLNKPDGTPNEITVDLSGARTIGDVAAMIKAHPPSGRQLYVEVTADRLTIQLDAVGGGNLTIREVGSGTVAEELGIRNLTGTGTSPLIGRPLDPILRNTTSLDDMFGSYATTVVHSMGTDNDIRLKADVMGETTSTNTGGAGTIGLNGITVQFVRTAGVMAGSEVVHPVAAGVLQVDVAGDGTSRARQVVAALNLAHQNHDIPFAADIDPLDDVYGGLGYLDIQPSNTTRDGYGESLDKSHGLRIVNNAGEHTIDLSAAQSLDDVLNILNGSDAGVIAEINQARNGINLLSKVSGCDFEIGENGGQTATQLGIRSFTEATPLSGMNYGEGVHVATNAMDLMAEATIVSSSQNGNVTLRAKKVVGDPNSDCWNNFTFSLDNTGDDPPTVNYNTVTRTLTVGIKPGTTTANDVKSAINANPAANADFEIVLGFNSDKTASDGTGLVEVKPPVITDGGAPKGNDFVITRSDGVDLYIDVSGAKTVENVLDLINNNPNNVVVAPGADRLYARLAAYGNGIELVDRSGGAVVPMFVKANPFSHAAIDLGLIPKGQTLSNPAIPDHSAAMITAGPHNDIIIHGRDPSSPIDGVQVIFTHLGSGVNYNENTRTLTVGLTAGETAAQAVAAINGSPAGALFDAYLDPTDCSSGNGPIVDNAIPYTMTGGSATANSNVTAVIPGLDNDLIFTAAAVGTTFENYDINFVDNPGSGAISIAHTTVPNDVITINYDSTTLNTSRANDIVAAWTNAANWAPDDPARTGIRVAIDRTDGTPNIGDQAVGDPVNTLAPMTTGVTVITGADVNPMETEGIFASLLRLRDALTANDVQGVQRSVDMLDTATTNMNYTRAALGARQQGLVVVQDRLATENVQLQVSLSDNHDADLAQVVSDLASRQTAYQASLMTLGKIMQMSLLDYM